MALIFRKLIPNKYHKNQVKSSGSGRIPGIPNSKDAKTEKRPGKYAAFPDAGGNAGPLPLLSPGATPPASRGPLFRPFSPWNCWPLKTKKGKKWPHGNQ
jgi:hypothetical protein